MRFLVLTIFPELFERFREVGLVGRACAEGRISIELEDLRRFAINTHGQIDDTPYGGGSGMVLRADAAAAALDDAMSKVPRARVVLFTPRGRPFDQRTAREIAGASLRGGAEGQLGATDPQDAERRAGGGAEGAAAREAASGAVERASHGHVRETDRGEAAEVLAHRSERSPERGRGETVAGEAGGASGDRACGSEAGGGALRVSGGAGASPLADALHRIQPEPERGSSDRSGGAVQGSHDLILLCSRYEGIDERIAEEWVDLEISMGDYVLMGGEVPAMAFIEAVARLVPGVLGNPESVAEESFESGLLEHPQYTKPADFRGVRVPDVLLSGNHREIARWRRERAYRDTAERRPDLIGRSVGPSCEVSVALVHHPVLDKTGEVITSSVTNLDLHDIARSARTYGLARYYVVHPTRALRRLSEKICEHWEVGYGATYNPNRSDALRTVTLVPDLDDVYADIELRTGQMPRVITTSAKNESAAVTFERMRGLLYASSAPHLILLGTGWGLTAEVIQRATYHLEPVRGHSDYNHLSVRAAAAIIFDRLLGA